MSCKRIKKTILLLFVLLITPHYLYADKHAFIFENDFVAGKDSDYTNGFFYTWMSEDNNQTNTAITFTHLMFTPDDISKKEKIDDDVPYAGYINLNFLLFKSTENYFHEFGVNIGAIGPIAQAKRFQKLAHHIISTTEPQGWDNQLKNKMIFGASYNIGYKTDVIDLELFEFDCINNARVDIGNFYNGGLISSTFRVGNNLQNNFVTTGNFIGGNESSLLNFKRKDTFGWSISGGFFLNKINHFYIIDKVKEKRISDIDYTTGEVISFNLHYRTFELSFKVKSIYRGDNRLFQGNITQWGGLSFRWIL